MDSLKHSLIWLLVGVVLGGVIGFLLGRQSVTVGELSVDVKRDTVTIHDTIPDHMPTARDSGLVKWMVVKVPVEGPRHSGDTVSQVVHDTIEVELPVMQKHYKTDSYQAWVSGYRPSLDSIEVYQKERIVTETVTVTQKARTRRWGVGVVGGYGYDFNSKQVAPFVGLGVSYHIFSF